MRHFDSIVDYIAAAIRYATEETHFKDWGNFIILLDESTSTGYPTICGILVYALPKGRLPLYFCYGIPREAKHEGKQSIKIHQRFSGCIPLHSRGKIIIFFAISDYTIVAYSCYNTIYKTLAADGLNVNLECLSAMHTFPGGS